MREQLNTVKTAVEEATKDFEQCLAEGIKNFITSEKKLKTFLDRVCILIIIKSKQQIFALFMSMHLKMFS